ncbi:MAG: hypothetical protein WCJ14_08865 [Verrucomicrobiota bacterium]
MAKTADGRQAAPASTWRAAPMLRLLLLFSLIPLALALAARWWFGERVLAGDGSRLCRCDLGGWLPPPGDTAMVHRAEESAGEFGRQLRLKALAEWRQRDPKATASRDKSQRFGAAVPPLSGVVAVLAVIVGKIPVLGAIAILLGATALAAVTGLLALAPELAAIVRTARQVREQHQFPRRDDEDAVIRCAMAHAWNAALPPILRWLVG